MKIIVRLIYLLAAYLFCGIINTIYAEDHENSEQKQDSEENSRYNDCMEIRFGSTSDKSPIIIYVVPSCLHCGEFLAEEVSEFLNKHGGDTAVVVRFIVPDTKDVFVLKLFYNKFLKKISKDQNLKDLKYNMFWEYVEYIKKVIANLPKNMAEPDIEYLKKMAIEFRFSKEEVEQAAPMADQNFEKAIVAKSAEFAEYIAKISGVKEIGTPYITKNDKEIKSFEEAMKIQDLQKEKEEIEEEPEQIEEVVIED
jgi:hypothetical protein